MSDSNTLVPADVFGARILVIDGNAVSRSILAGQLDAWGFEHADCGSGPEGLAVLRMAAAYSMVPDAVILDSHLTEMSGNCLLREIRREPAIRDIPVIMLAAPASHHADTGPDGSRAVTSLTKPTISSVMLETIVTVISGARNGNRNNVKPASFADIARYIAENRSPDESAPSAVVEMKQDGSHAAFAPDKTVPMTSATGNEAAPGDDRAYDILVAEGNEVYQIVIRQVLREAGHSYKIVANGSLAVAAFKVHKPRLVLMDVSMPEMNGEHATHAIRKLDSLAGTHTPIVGITSHTLNGEMEKCFEAGMDDYLSLPVSEARLLEKVTTFLESPGSAIAYSVA